jgi:hypothetical protein
MGYAGGLIYMEGTNNSRYKTGNAVCDALRFLCDASFAVLPRDVAQQFGEFEKNLWGDVRWFAEKNIGWIDDSLAAADRLREEWRRPRAATPPTHRGPEPL